MANYCENVVVVAVAVFDVDVVVVKGEKMSVSSQNSLLAQLL